MDERRYIEDMTERYVYQVARRLPAKIRGDIEQELRELISDMLEERRGGAPAARKDIDVVLAELGDPALFAAKYQGEARSLIGPALFPQYAFLLKTVLAAVALGMTISSALLAIRSPSPFWLLDVGGWLANLLFAFAMAFAWVTLIFGFLEWRGVSLGLFTGTGALPPVPVKHEKISRWEPVSGIIFICFAAIVFLFLPQILVAVISIGDEIAYLSIFDEAVLKLSLPFLLLSLGLGVIRECCKLLEGRYTMRLALVTVVCDLAALALTVFVFGNSAIWNPDFGPAVARLVDFGPGFSFALLWSYFTRYFVVILIFSYLLSMGTTLFRAIRYRPSRRAV